MGKNKSKKHKEPQYVEMEEINIIAQIPSNAARIIITAEYIDGDSGKLQQCRKYMRADDIRKARQDFLDNVEDGDDYNERYFITEEGMRFLEEVKAKRRNGELS